MMERFIGKVAMVTGAANGIGAAIAARLLSEGCNVAICDLEDPTTTPDGPGQSIVVNMDVSNRASVGDGIRRTVDAFGRLDIMVANAGIVDRLPFLEFTDELWSRVLAVNLNGAFHCGQEAARQMVSQGNGGRIINIASNSGIFGGRGRAAYGASKAAIINLTQTMAIELAEHDITANAVAPGAVKTRVTRGDVPGPSVMQRAPIARYGHPDEIAAVVAFLASDESTFVTGHVYCADGGYTTAGVMEG